MYNEEMNKLTQIALSWELYQNRMPKVDIAKATGVHRETVGIWIERIEKLDRNVHAFLDQYVNAKKGERKKKKLDGLLKARIYRVREENRSCCGQKIKEYLKAEFGRSPGVTTIYKVLREKYQLRSKWKKNQKRGPVPKAQYPRQVIQMDSVDFGGVFAFTGIDIFSKEVVVKLYPSLTSRDGEDFLHYAFHTRFKKTELLQTDGGSEFKDKFKRNVFKYAERFRIARPYRKNEQAYIESFNRTLRKECLGWGNYPKRELPVLEEELGDYLVYYHSRRVHLSLNMKTPNEVLNSYQLVSDI